MRARDKLALAMTLSIPILFVLLVVSITALAFFGKPQPPILSNLASGLLGAMVGCGLLGAMVGYGGAVAKHYFES